jgi:hypothetical protein
MDRRMTMTVVLAAAVLLAGAALWWQQRGAAPVAAPPVTAAAPLRSEAPAPAPAVELPPPAPTSPLSAAEVPGALSALLGDAGARLVLTDGFARRFVATVDSLGRDHAPVMAWPVLPTPGRFAVDEAADAGVPSSANAARYEPFVRLAESVDAAQAARFYRRIYPLLAAAYRDLGFPHGEFHTRLIAVIDLLLATPQPAQTPAVHLLDVKGSVPSLRPWVRYEFVDPQLQSLAAGQKILLRVGPANERRLKAKLAQLRTALTAREPGPD